MSNQHTPYDAVADGAAWIDKRARGRLRFDGKDAASFLHALVSNDVAALQPGHGVYATYLTPQGRMIADLRIHHRGDHLLADVPPGLAANLAERFDALIFSEDVRVTDVSTTLAALAVLGANAPAAVAQACGLDAGRVAALATWAHESAGDFVYVRSDDVAWPCFDVFVPAGGWHDLVGRLRAAGVDELPDALADALRIEAGRPAFGIDMTAETIPLEAGLLERAISQNKGCYVGQEVIVRVLHRGGGRVAKRLVTLEFDAAVRGIPAAGEAIVSGGRETGRITSAAWSPSLARVVALGYVHRDAGEPGTPVAVRVDAVDEIARVTGLAG